MIRLSISSLIFAVRIMLRADSAAQMAAIATIETRPSARTVVVTVDNAVGRTYKKPNMKTIQSLSVRTFGQDSLLRVIPKGTECPNEFEFSLPPRQNQRRILIEAFAGEDGIANSTLIARIELLVGSCGDSYLRVYFRIDQDGLLSVHASDSFTNQSIECCFDPDSLLLERPRYLVQKTPRTEVLNDETLLNDPIVGRTETLSSITIQRTPELRRVELVVGDLSNHQEDLDVLVISAFPNEYAPISGSVIAALEKWGVSIQELARHPDVDLRSVFSCWMSSPLSNVTSAIPFGRILCYEPRARGTPAETIGDIFRSLAPFVGQDVRNVGMPLVAAGHQGEEPHLMLKLLVEAATRWIATGMPIESVKIFLHPDGPVDDLCRTFNTLRAEFLQEHTSDQSKAEYDYFLSYAHDNQREANWISTELLRLQPNLRVFIDENELDPGSAWQQKIYEAIDQSQRVLSLLSTSYLNSKVCLEEFNIAAYRHRESSESVLFPVLLESACLPTYMKMMQFVDCREYDHEKMRKACATLSNLSEN